MDEQIKGLKHDGKAPNEKKYPFDTIFSQILNSKLPPEDLSQQRLQHEAMSLIGAGIETTNWVLSAACYHIISNPKVRERLADELESAIPDPSEMPAQEELEKLRYLSACIEEGGSLTLLSLWDCSFARLGFDGIALAEICATTRVTCMIPLRSCKL